MEDSMSENKTAVIEARLDMRDLAACADFLVAQGIAPRSKSDLLYKIVATFAKSAIDNHAVQKYEMTAEALAHLQDLGLGSMNRMLADGRRANSFTLSKTVADEEVSGSVGLDNNTDYWKNLIKSGKVKIPGE
jgi:hypothetical protein